MTFTNLHCIAPKRLKDCQRLQFNKIVTLLLKVQENQTLLFKEQLYTAAQRLCLQDANMVQKSKLGSPGRHTRSRRGDVYRSNVAW